MTTNQDSRFTDKIVLRVPPRLPPLIDRAAERSCCTATEYMRRAIVMQLRADGFNPNGVSVPVQMPELPHDDEWQAEHYAKVEGDVILVTQPGPLPQDGSTWLPVINVDERAFDPARHYRLKPRLELRGGYVARVYPIIDKSADGTELIARGTV